MKLIAFILIPICLSSCITYRKVARDQVLTPELIRTKIVLGKKHQLTMKTGKKLRVRILRVDDTKVYGNLMGMNDNGKKEWSPFEDNLENMANNLTKLEVLKVNVPVVVASAGVPLIFFMYARLSVVVD